MAITCDVTEQPADYVSYNWLTNRVKVMEGAKRERVGGTGPLSYVQGWRAPLVPETAAANIITTV